MINDLVIKMIEKHQGGERFFDNLDAALKNQDYIEMLMDKVPDFCIPISTGKFGLYLSSILSSKGIFNIVVNGSLRKGEKIISLKPFEDKIYGNLFAFIDDSFYSGRTRDTIQAELMKYGGYIFRSYVCYDGSKILDPNVISLYRYYDHFKE